MAYLNFSALQGDPVTTPADLLPSAGFTPLERQVISLARRDRLSSLRQPGPVATALGVLFGGHRVSPRLADARLEALRRSAVLAWHRGPTLPQHEIDAFYAAGFTTPQFDALIAIVSSDC
ncbi:hypothetical protein [Sphingomonas xinjiangensis]|uniref:Uncharacterized protein n=1 Tax=Sphingomonas xinjiangensis TaxID=643568 RepID=A0A840YD13_9SPHN|nr:hypothetical protein [Sphingomonas xinjiangensis]MBB5709899.1 hypothetical protein [Sphingomonas xinjiangensis]